MNKSSNWIEIFKVFLSLGLTSFGGPVAHLGYFRNEIVERRKWIDEHLYADLIAMCQFLPGPASSQIGISIGLIRGGYKGAVAAWLGFTLPSAIAMALFAYGVTALRGSLDASWLHGFKIAAVVIVTQAVWVMGSKLTPDWKRLVFAAIVAAFTLLMPSAWGQISAIIVGGFFGILLLKQSTPLPHMGFTLKVDRSVAISCLVLFLLLLIALPLLETIFPNHHLRVFDSFYRTGSLVFGGGHVVLPLLKTSVVNTGWMTNETFLAGYGAAQAIPGPLFTFAAYIGAIMNGWAGAILCLIAIFLPSFLLIIGIFPFWSELRKHPNVQSAIHGVNTSVVGILLAALYHPVWTSGILSIKDFVIFIIAFLFLQLLNVPSWLVTLLCALSGAPFARF